MKTVVGNQQKDINKNTFLSCVKDFKKVEIDLGTGDGRFAFKQALKNPGTLYIGIDPVRTQMEEFSKKALRKKLKNIIFIIGSIELLPEEIKNTADKVYINLPWGSLMEHIVNPTPETVNRIIGLIKQTGGIEIVFGYLPEIDSKIDLGEIDEEFIRTNISPAFEKSGYFLKSLGKINPENIDTTWAKRLKHRKNRQIYKIVLEND